MKLGDLGEKLPSTRAHGSRGGNHPVPSLKDFSSRPFLARALMASLMRGWSGTTLEAVTEHLDAADEAGDGLFQQGIRLMPLSLFGADRGAHPVTVHHLRACREAARNSWSSHRPPGSQKPPIRRRGSTLFLGDVSRLLPEAGPAADCLRNINGEPGGDLMVNRPALYVLPPKPR